jgi:hypothetical protein
MIDPAAVPILARIERIINFSEDATARRKGVSGARIRYAYVTAGSDRTEQKFVALRTTPDRGEEERLEHAIMCRWSYGHC